MALTSKQKADAFKARNTKLGRREGLRGIYMTEEEDAHLKPLIREMLKRMRNA